MSLQGPPPHDCILALCSRHRKKHEAACSTLSSQWLWLLPKIRTTLKEWGFATSEDIQRICFRLWKQFQEEFENPFEQKQYRWKKCASPPRWCFEGQEFTGLCKLKFHSFSFLFFLLLFFFLICHTTVFKYLIKYHMKELDQNCKIKSLQAGGINIWSSQGIWKQGLVETTGKRPCLPAWSTHDRLYLKQCAGQWSHLGPDLAIVYQFTSNELRISLYGHERTKASRELQGGRFQIAVRTNKFKKETAGPKWSHLC